MAQPSLKDKLGVHGPASFGLVDVTLLLVATIWGTNNVVARAAFGQFEPGAFIVLRFAIATAIMLVFLRFAESPRPIDKADWGRFLLAGLLGTALVQPLFYYGLSLSTASNTSLIKATSPIFVAIFAWFMLSERLRPRGWLGCGLALAGMALIVQEGLGFELHGRALLGDLLALAGASLWAAYMVVVGPLTKRYSALQVTAYTTLIGTIPLVVLGSPLLAWEDWGRVDAWGWSALLYSAVFGVFLAYVLWNAGIRKIGSTRHGDLPEPFAGDRHTCGCRVSWRSDHAGPIGRRRDHFSGALFGEILKKGRDAISCTCARGRPACPRKQGVNS